MQNVLPKFVKIPRKFRNRMNYSSFNSFFQFTIHSLEVPAGASSRRRRRRRRLEAGVEQAHHRRRAVEEGRELLPLDVSRVDDVRVERVEGVRVKHLGHK